MKGLEGLARSAKEKLGLDYLEIRLEETVSHHLSFRGPELEEASHQIDRGGCVRALRGSGWGFSSFNRWEELERRISEAAELARVADRGERVILAPVQPVVDEVPAEVGEDPAGVPLEEKKDILSAYNEIILGFGRGVATSLIRYFDRRTKLTFASSEGSLIVQERVDLGGAITAVAAREGTVRQVSVPFGSGRDFSVVRGLKEEVQQACATASSLLAAPPAPGGEMPVVLDPILSGVFVHEAFGHLSEADGMHENPELEKTMRLGRVLGPPFLHIFDSGVEKGARGYLAYDDEGVRTEKTYLIREGRIVGRLHSRETAGKMGERPTGNARALSYRHPPIVRMRNTGIEPGEASLEDLLAEIEEGLYCAGFYGGETMGEMFTFTPQVAYRIRKGRIEEPVREATLSGNVFHTLAAIEAIGREVARRDDGGGCGKGGQAPLPVSHWCPPIRIARCLVGGRR